MSRAAISEEDSIKYPHLVAQFHPVSPKPRAPPKSEVDAPPIPLALPLLLEAERKSQQDQDRGSESPSEKEDNTLFSAPLKQARTSSPQWPGKLHLVSSSTTTTQQSSSVAEAAADRDEHSQRPRRSMVKTKIKDLLTSTGRKISGGMHPLEGSIKTDSSSVHVREMGSGTEGVDFIDGKKVPQLQAAPSELKKLYTTDGRRPARQMWGSLADQGHTGTSSSKVMPRQATFGQQLRQAGEQRSGSPVKANPSTPSRGRTRGGQSPGGRPYSVDHRFTLSPSRSNSRGSRGSLTFNIKARVSPGRGLGKKDDTELFVTANIESDDSD